MKKRRGDKNRNRKGRRNRPSGNKTFVLRLNNDGYPVYGTREQWEAVQRKGVETAIRTKEQRDAATEAKAENRQEAARAGATGSALKNARHRTK